MIAEWVELKSPLDWFKLHASMDECTEPDKGYYWKAVAITDYADESSLEEQYCDG